MTIRDRHPFPVAGLGDVAKRPMPWRERLRLKCLLLRIDELEQQLADEFATFETAPMLAELQTLRAEQDALLARFSRPEPG